MHENSTRPCPCSYLVFSGVEPEGVVSNGQLIVNPLCCLNLGHHRQHLHVHVHHYTYRHVYIYMYMYTHEHNNYNLHSTLRIFLNLREEMYIQCTRLRSMLDKIRYIIISDRLKSEDTHNSYLHNIVCAT